MFWPNIFYREKKKYNHSEGEPEKKTKIDQPIRILIELYFANQLFHSKIF